MGRRILNRKEMRADFDAAERRKDDDTEEKEEEGEDEEEDEDEDEAEGEEEPEGEGGDEEEPEEGEGDEDDEEAPKKKKKKKVAKPKPPKVAKPKTRSRAAKIVRMRVVWGVFDNSNRCVATYEYPRKAEAEAHVARLITDKRSTHFLQPVKEPIEDKEKKEK